MITQKLYALKTSDTGEWVVWDEKFRDRPGYRIWDYPTEIVPEDQRFICRSAQALKDTGHPCKWVEVWVIEAKAVDDAVIDNLNEYGPVSDDNTDNSSVTWAEGFRACLRYLGVG